MTQTTKPLENSALSDKIFDALCAYRCVFTQIDGYGASLSDLLTPPNAKNIILGVEELGELAAHIEDAIKEKEPQTTPLKGNWHHANGYVCCGTLRIFKADFDTNPSDDFKQELTDWVCETLNRETRKKELGDE